MTRPEPASEHVRRRLSRTRTRDTAPEMALRRELHSRGLRYRVNVTDLVGRPDVVFRRVRVAVFVDGCFWHSCPQHGNVPKNNREWWRAKLNRTVQRDRQTDDALRAEGWRVVRVWEHEDPDVAADRIEALIRVDT